MLEDFFCMSDFISLVKLLLTFLSLKPTPSASLLSQNYVYYIQYLDN